MPLLIELGKVPDRVIDMPVPDPATREEPLPGAWPVMPLLIKLGKVPDRVIDMPVPDPATREEPLPGAWPVPPVPELLV